MNDPYSSKPGLSVHVPMALLGLAIAIFLCAQIGAASQGAKTMKWQLGNLDSQVENLQKAQKDFDDAMVKREELVKQAAAIEAQYTSLLNDVLELAKEDEDARKVVEKWKIQRSAPPANPPAAVEGSAGAKPDEAK
jgi:uncharacterized protein involved in exopolysaccharide biosynthesis